MAKLNKNLDKCPCHPTRWQQFWAWLTQPVTRGWIEHRFMLVHLSLSGQAKRTRRIEQDLAEIKEMLHKLNEKDKISDEEA